MKHIIKTILVKIGLLKAARVGYSFFKGLSVAVITTELKAKLRKNNIPIPPERLIFLVIGYRWAKIFLDSGKTISEAMIRQLTKNNIAIDSFTSILDFGCGCGRIIRHLPSQTNAKLYGCDYNSELIGWCQKNLSFAAFTKNELAPPLGYPDESFDFIYARSVFTHLDEPLQKKWITELRRILKLDGYLYFTTHGEQFFGRLSSTEKQSVREGNIIIFQAQEEGHNICTSFELPKYVYKNLLQGFKLINYEPGLTLKDLQQDSYILQKTL